MKKRHSVIFWRKNNNSTRCWVPPRHSTAGHRSALTRLDTSFCGHSPQSPSAFGSQRWGYCRGRSPQTPRTAGLARRPRRPREAAAGARRSPPFAQPEPGLSQSTSRDSWRSSPDPPESPAASTVRDNCWRSGRGGTPGPAALGQLLVGKATSLLGNPGQLKLVHAHAGGPAQAQRTGRCSRGAHT